MATIVGVHGLIGKLGPLDLLGYGAFADAPVDSIHLDGQVEHMARQTGGSGKRHLIAHSVGGAVAMLFAARYPERVATIVNIEGNFTLRDAFMTSKMAAMRVEDLDAMLAAQRADVAAWLASKGIAVTDERCEVARVWLGNQPGSTVLAMSQSVIAVTGAPAYLETLRGVFDSGIPVHLVAGERSRAGWDVPEWALEKASSVTVLPGTGHFPMVEDPAGFEGLLSRLLLSQSNPSRRA